MARRRILQVGYFGKNNVGDDLFQELVKELWPNIDFTFDDNASRFEEFDGVWFGPGDILDGNDTVYIPKEIPVGFLGVGFNPFATGDNYKELLRRAKFIVSRDQRAGIFPSVVVMPDLAFAADCSSYVPQNTEKKIVILMNDNLVGRPGGEAWMTTAWNWFSQEFAVVCDLLIENGYRVAFRAMQMAQVDDRLAAAAIISSMTRGVMTLGSEEKVSHLKIKQEIASSHCVITARLHGAIFACQLGVPFVPLLAHDKMKSFCEEIRYAQGKRAEFFGARRHEIWNAFKESTSSETDSLLKYSKKALHQWRDFAATLENKFFG